MLEWDVEQYRNRSLETAQIIQEFIELAKQMRAAHKCGEKLGLTKDELAFYDVLETNDSAVAQEGDENLKTISRKFVETVRRNATVDWALREVSTELQGAFSVPARVRRLPTKGRR